jgi:hypothetical protein
VYAARAKDKDLTFVVSGMLWQRSLVMMDLETRSLWSHLLGRAMSGPLKGQELEALPSVVTDWKTWRAEHPDTTVLSLSHTSREHRREFYRHPSQFVLGMAEEGAARAWPFDQLVRQPVVNDEFNRAPVLVVFMSDSATAIAYDRRSAGRTLTFRNENGRLLDNETSTQWDPASGQAVAGPLFGKQLTQRIGNVSYLRAWRDFHPESSYWKNN